jgi:catechol 2,3-dioxygenase-like lactoylglutathione lyase family enzyme
MKLDRLIIKAHDVDAARAAYARFFDAAPTAEGFSIGGIVLAIRPGGDAPEGLAGLVFAVEDPDAAAARLGRLGLTSTAEDGEFWLDAAATWGVRLGLTRVVPRTGEGAISLDHVVINTPDAERAAALYGARLGLDFRLDRSAPQWNARLLFFRAGAATVEISAPLTREADPGPDRLGGLAWRVDDVAATRACLAAQDFDISEVRVGRKPGTAVCTLRKGVIGAPWLLIGPSGDA